MHISPVKTIVTVGIDPGKQGGVVVLRDGQELLYKAITPTVDVGRKKPKISYDEGGMVRILDDVASLKPDYVVLEQQQAFPARVDKKGKVVREGSTSNFTTGLGYGLWRGMLAVRNLGREYVAPQKWTRRMLAGIEGDGKNRNRIAVQRHLPGVDLLATPRCRVPHEGLVDAALLARWAYLERLPLLLAGAG